jgi:hypothetical protein
MVRSWHPNVPLIPDFVEGMRNHVNATQAMLLYMQRTWTDLVASPTVANAFSSGIASQDQLMAAGYNSNPAKIAGYINRGGESWTGLIPRETKKDLEKRLDPRRFQRVHRSTIVNLDLVRQVKPHTNGECFLVLDSGSQVKVSRSYRDVVARFVH